MISETDDSSSEYEYESAMGLATSPSNERGIVQAEERMQSQVPAAQCELRTGD